MPSFSWQCTILSPHLSIVVVVIIFPFYHHVHQFIDFLICPCFVRSREIKKMIQKGGATSGTSLCILKVRSRKKCNAIIRNSLRFRRLFIIHSMTAHMTTLSYISIERRWQPLFCIFHFFDVLVAENYAEFTCVWFFCCMILIICNIQWRQNSLKIFLIYVWMEKIPWNFHKITMNQKIRRNHLNI